MKTISKNFAITPLVILLLFHNTDTFAENALLLSLKYEIIINSKHKLTTSIRYNYDEYPEYLLSETLTKSSKNTPPKLKITSTTISKYLLSKSPILVSQEIDFIQGDVRIISTSRLLNDSSLVANVIVFTNDKQVDTFSLTNKATNLYDIPIIIFLVSTNNLSSTSEIPIFYDNQITNISLKKTSSTSPNRPKEILKFKKISGLNVLDSFRVSNVVVGIFTNAYVEGKLVDLSIVRRSEVERKD